MELIDRQAAINKICKDVCGSDVCKNPCREIAILQYFPATVPCEDAVSRAAVIEITAETGALETQYRVKRLPPVTPKQRTGEWIIDDDTEKFMMHCSECGKFQDSRYDRRFLFCPNCGAKMKPKGKE